MSIAAFPERPVNSSALGDQHSSAITVLADGRILIAFRTWAVDDGEVPSPAVAARLLNADGTPAGVDVLLDTSGANDQAYPSVTTLADGSLVAVWQSGDGGDGVSSCIRARLLTVGGSPLGTDFIVNTMAASDPGDPWLLYDQQQPSVTSLANGGYVVTWATAIGPSTAAQYDIHARAYGADGVALGGEFAVNQATAGDQLHPAVEALARGRFVATWDS